ncbi:probable G-protein coupled receptor 82 [Dendrobates tinctorius]|uniref:probable G-protein coupled receptor 82 n=1 Tax=Dendrobates tinctorius TaxID=92724 RepID=UPI003CC9398B
MGNYTEHLNFSAITSTGLPTAYALMFLPSLSGNVISLVIFRRMSRKTSMHIYLINLAVSNMIVSAGMPFQVIYYISAEHWPYNSTLCTIVYEGASLLTHCSMCVSVTIFCWIAVTRYATLIRHKVRMQCKPKTTYEKIIFSQMLKSFQNPQFALYLCIGVWFTLLCPNILVFLANQNPALDKKCFDKEAETVQLVYKITSVVESTCFFTFFLLVLLCYYFFMKHIQQIQANSCIGKKHLVYSKVKTNIVVIAALLLLCFTPYHVSKFFLVRFDYSYGCKYLSALIEVKNCCLCLAEFRSCTDPMVYFCLDVTFKKNFQLFYKKRSADEKVNSTAINESTMKTPTISGRILKSNIIPNESYQ